jgi:hypothetical protein
MGEANFFMGESDSHQLFGTESIESHMFDIEMEKSEFFQNFSQILFFKSLIDIDLNQMERSAHPIDLNEMERSHIFEQLR